MIFALITSQRSMKVKRVIHSDKLTDALSIRLEECGDGTLSIVLADGRLEQIIGGLQNWIVAYDAYRLVVKAWRDGQGKPLVGCSACPMGGDCPVLRAIRDSN